MRKRIHPLNTCREDSSHLGQFFTPSELCLSVVKYLEISQYSTVLDPTCGRGDFLYACPNPNNCTGIEIDKDLCRQSMERMSGAKIICDDVMNHIDEGKFDYVLSNPPFNLSFSDPKNKLLSSNNGKVVSCIAVLEIALKSAKSKGYVAIIMPRFSINQYPKLKAFILDNAELVHEEGLNPLMWKGAAPISTLLIFHKK